jgi:hypothetical protein
MKSVSYIIILALLFMSSCTSRLYTGADYDDLYFSPSDNPVVAGNQSASDKLAGGNQQAGNYYDNIYAADTLVSDQYSDAVDYNDQIINNNYDNGGGYSYYDNYSYSNRLNMFYGNYFNPYWRDPFYPGYGSFGSGFGFGYGMGFGMGYGSGFGFDYGWGGYPYGYGYPGYGWGYPYYDYGLGYYGLGYGGYYGGYYSPYHNDDNFVSYHRRERPSNLSSAWNRNEGTLGTSRRGSYVSSGRASGIGRSVSSGAPVITGDQRKTVSSVANSRQAISQDGRGSVQDPTGTTRSGAISNQRGSINERPVYNNANRTYTPSYSNPRMNTRPSYNNSRVSEGFNQGTSRSNAATNSGRMNSNSGTVRNPVNQGIRQNSSNNSRNNSSGNGTRRRFDSPSGYFTPQSESRSGSYRNYNNLTVPSSGNRSGSGSNYSVPSSRRSTESRSSFSSGSSYSPSSGSRSSYSSGSSVSGSRGSYSSGGSSSGSSGSSGSSTRSSSGSGRR